MGDRLPLITKQETTWQQAQSPLRPDVLQTGATGDELQADQPMLTDQQKSVAEAVLTGKTLIESQLNAINDPSQTLPIIRKYLADGGSLDDIRLSYASSITEAENSTKPYRADIIAALEIETKRLQIITEAGKQIVSPEATGESIQALLTEYETKYPDRDAKDLIPESLTTDQLQKVESAQKNIAEARHQQDLKTWQAAIDTFVSEQDKLALTDTAKLMQTPTFLRMAKELGVPDQRLSEVQNLLKTKASEQVAQIEADEKSERKLRNIQLAALGIMFVLDPWERRKILEDLLKDDIPEILQRLGLTKEQVEVILGNFSPGSEIARLPFRQFEPAFQKLGNREIFQMLKNMPKGERVAFVKEHKYEGRKLGGGSERKIDEFMSWLSPNYQKELGIYSSTETTAA